MLFIKLKSFIRDYLTLTSRERKGALVLASIILFQLLIIIRLHYVLPPSEPVLTTYRSELDAFTKKIKTSDLKKAALFNVQPEDAKAKPILKPFNPNTIGDDEWMKLGLSEKQTRVIRNYIDKGGFFPNKESISKMYCISAEQYKQLEPWIRIPEPEKPFTSKYKTLTGPVRKISKVELNAADTLQLTGLPLVGPGRARLIYKYRERLGGFVSKEQLLEVFTMDSITVEAIRPYLEIDTNKIRKLNMNSDSLNHPYLNRRTAAAIISYRKQHGNFFDINGLRKVTLLDDQMWVKVAPYAAFE